MHVGSSLSIMNMAPVSSLSICRILIISSWSFNLWIHIMDYPVIKYIYILILTMTSLQTFCDAIRAFWCYDMMLDTILYYEIYFSIMPYLFMMKFLTVSRMIITYFSINWSTTPILTFLLLTGWFNTQTTHIWTRLSNGIKTYACYCAWYIWVFDFKHDAAISFCMQKLVNGGFFFRAAHFYHLINWSVAQQTWWFRQSSKNILISRWPFWTRLGPALGDWSQTMFSLRDIVFG